jgi:hypothetical protein
MPWFKVEIRGAGLERAMAALHGADIPTIGPAFYWQGEVPRVAEVGDRMVAVLDAATAEAAEARVRDTLPADGGYTVESAGIWQRG